MNLRLGRIDQIALTVGDLDRAEDFYVGKMGLRRLERIQDKLLFIDCGGVTLLLETAHGEHKPSSPEKPAFIIYFDCPDLALATRELELRGVKTFYPPHLVARREAFAIYMAFFADPDGNLVALKQSAPTDYVFPGTA